MSLRSKFTQEQVLEMKYKILGISPTSSFRENLVTSFAALMGVQILINRKLPKEVLEALEKHGVPIPIRCMVN